MGGWCWVPFAGWVTFAGWVRGRV
ncbi:hypothetical protein TIFTF001_055318, partial [Ficus carica]